MEDDNDLDDTHFCIKCKTTIYQIENYIAHRKKGCLQVAEIKLDTKNIVENKKETPRIDLECHAYTSLVFNTSPSNNNRKRQDDNYDLATELGADVFFSSLQLQSVESLHQYQRQKSQDHPDWLPNQTLEFDRNLRGTETESSAQEEEDESEDEHVEPIVPSTHTGGKWQPEYRLRISPYVLSPNWDFNIHEEETFLQDMVEQHHPPADHTRGKWVPGSKMQLDYKQFKNANANEEYWCNICCRKLKGKTNYEHHLKTNYHRKRAQPEQQLEKVQLEELQTVAFEERLIPLPEQNNETKRKRRKIFFKCDLCKYKVLRHLTGKHLISHFHYRCMQTRGIKEESLNIILDNMHWIVLQSPFQCRLCNFYTNTEENFLQHWNSLAHLENCVGPGNFWCSYCQFACHTNIDMYEHLLSEKHKEVLLIINRSVPVCISRKVDIRCPHCQQCFRYNVELRKHQQICQSNANLSEIVGSASDIYQSRHICKLCMERFRSKLALQRHQKYKHNLAKYFCSICDMEFSTALLAKRHRKTLNHKQTRDKNKLNENQVDEHNAAQKTAHFVDEQDHTDERKHCCLICGKTFAVSQALGRHTRKCQLKNVQNKVSTNQNEISKLKQCKECDFK